jgi:hypothetical protein
MSVFEKDFKVAQGSVKKIEVLKSDEVRPEVFMFRDPCRGPFSIYIILYLATNYTAYPYRMEALCLYGNYTDLKRF